MLHSRPSLTGSLGACALCCWFVVLPALAQEGMDRILFEARPLSAPPRAAQVQATTTGAAEVTAEALAEAADAADIERYLESIANEELEKGPFAPELLQQFLSLGQAYQEQGEHTAALEAFEQAEYLSRINNGLYAPEQFAIVENMIESHLAGGDLREANEKQQYLLFIKQQYYGEESLEVVPALAAVGDWNMNAFNGALGRRNALNLAPNPEPGFRINAPSPQALAFGNLFRAQGNYYQAIMNLVRHRRIDDPRLMELEIKLVEGIFLGANREGLMDDPDFYLDKRRTYTGTRISRRGLRGYSASYINGRNAYSRMRIYQEYLPDTDPEALARTMVGQGDWHMLFDRRLSALDHYREAWNYLLAEQVPQSRIEALLNPPVPVQLPVFTPLPHSREQFGIDSDATLDYSGHIDVSFRITRFGNIRDLEVLARTENVDADLERRLKRLLRSSPFRPRLVDGEPLRDDQIALRYYFARLD